MSIDEAIRYCVEVAEEQEELYRICPLSESEMSHCNGTKDCRVLKNGKNKGCQKCAEEHRQLAGWLEELKELRNMTAGHLYAVAFNRGYLKDKKEVREKAIDDFVKELQKKIEKDLANPDLALECKKCEIWKNYDIEEIAEQLNEGVKYEM